MGACCPTIRSAGWPDLTPMGSTSINAASRSATWKYQVVSINELFCVVVGEALRWVSHQMVAHAAVWMMIYCMTKQVMQ